MPSVKSWPQTHMEVQMRSISGWSWGGRWHAILWKGVNRWCHPRENRLVNGEDSRERKPLKIYLFLLSLIVNLFQDNKHSLNILWGALKSFIHLPKPILWFSKASHNQGGLFHIPHRTLRNSTFWFACLWNSFASFKEWLYSVPILAYSL